MSPPRQSARRAARVAAFAGRGLSTAVLAAAIGGGLIGCGRPPGDRVAAGRLPACPARAPAVRQRITPTDELVAGDPIAAQICDYEPGPSPVRATLDGALARTLTLLLNQTSSGHTRAAACGDRVDTVISLVYAAATTTVTTVGCADHEIVIDGSRFAELPLPAADAILGAAFTGSPGPVRTPSLLGLRRAAADRAADAFAPGSGSGVSGELVDAEHPFGSVVWQEPLPGVGQGSPPQDLDMLVAVPRAPPCRVDELAGRYLNGGNGTGNHFGNIVLFDTSDRACRIAGRISLTGLDRAGRADTVVATETLAPPLVLSPRATPRAVLSRPSGVLAAIFGFDAEVRDDPTAVGGLCYSHETYPSTWSLRLGRQRTPLRLRNRGPGSGGRFLTCHGQFGFGLGDPFALYS
jgi:hypothetical protein